MRSIENADRGFSLIEVVVAMTIMTLLSVVVLSAVRNSTTIWEKTSGHIEGLHRSRITFDVLRDQIRGAMPLFQTVKDGDRTINSVSFDGDRNHVRFVSRSSFKDGPNTFARWIELQWLVNANGHGELNVEERRILPPGNLPESNVYWRGSLLPADSCSFDFLKPGAGSQPAAWIPSWHSPANPFLPRAVRVACTSRAKNFAFIVPLDFAESSSAGLVLK